MSLNSTLIQCSKWSTRGGGAQLVMGDRATGGHEVMAWVSGIFEFCLLKWSILVSLSCYSAQSTGLMRKG